MEWLTEPDTNQFFHEGLRCTIKRAGGPEHLCGYVGVPPEHPLFGKDYDEKVPYTKETLEREIGTLSPILIITGSIEQDRCTLALIFDVHGGLSWARDHAAGYPPDGLWHFGFDCGHSGDKSPGRNWSTGGIYRNWEYVEAQVKSLATQLAQYQKDFTP